MKIWEDGGQDLRHSSSKPEGGAEDACGNWNGQGSAYFKGYAPAIPHCFDISVFETLAILVVWCRRLAAYRVPSCGKGHGKLRTGGRHPGKRN